jgi:hypothetical protein
LLTIRWPRPPSIRTLPRNSTSSQVGFCDSRAGVCC